MHGSESLACSRNMTPRLSGRLIMPLSESRTSTQARREPERHARLIIAGSRANTMSGGLERWRFLRHLRSRCPLLGGASGLTGTPRVRGNPFSQLPWNAPTLRRLITARARLPHPLG